jgi:ankyrin repeat protein
LKWLLKHNPRDTEERVWQLTGLAWADPSGTSAKYRAAQARALAALQEPDGGWNSLPGRGSDAYSTSEVLVALHDTGGWPISSERWQRGIAYLIRNQEADGSWRVASRLHPPAAISPPYFDSGYPYGHDQYISMSAASFAIEALASALGPQSESPRLSWKQDMQDVEPWAETVLFGSVADLKALLDANFNPNSATRSGGTTALMMAAPDPEKLRLLLDRGANVNARAKSNYTALMVAAVSRDATPAVKLLLARGAETGRPPGSGKRLWSPLKIAAEVGNPDVIQALSAAGDSLNDTLITAVRTGQRDAVRKLLDLGAAVDEPWDRDGSTALDRAVLGNDVELATLLIARGANVNHVCRNGFTPLLYAASIDFGDSALIDLLLKSGARPEITTKEGLTALDLARRYKHTNLVPSLAASQAGARVQ